MGPHGSLTVAMPEFWQQFPKALELDGTALRFMLFPFRSPYSAELQGGERKTHTVWLHFAPPDQADEHALDWVNNPCTLAPPPEWVAASGVIPEFCPEANEPDSRLREYLLPAVEGENSLFARREVIDEYGWRNYGEIYADHEAAHYKGPPPVVSHYNNQYDSIYGTLLQFLRTDDARWFALCDPLARHVMDIDIYHTTKDRAAYNGGMFWHTDHYRDAGTATHRAYSRINVPKDGSPYGGGPSNQHNYTTGLLHYHYFTGSTDAREAVVGLADWVIRMDDGRTTIFGLLDDGPTGFASFTRDPSYHGPGRGSGNSVNALLDGWLLTSEAKYLDKAQELIRRCIHPRDDLAEHDLLNAEDYWSYTIFLEALGRYLRFKASAGQVDCWYAYGRASLLHYAEWMAEHEVPYLDHPEKLEYPTETWAAQDFRKAHVLRLAAAHVDEPWRSRFWQRGKELADRAWEDLLRFPSRHVARALAIMMTEGVFDAHARVFPLEPMPVPDREYDFGRPERFVPQKQRVLRQMKTPAGLARAAVKLLNPLTWPRAFALWRT